MYAKPTNTSQGNADITMCQGTGKICLTLH